MAGCLKGDHDPSDVTGLCDELIPHPLKKKLITKEKMGQINVMKTNSKRRKN
jgi:hypothetical protein